jgi:hypothetical protein
VALRSPGAVTLGLGLNWAVAACAVWPPPLHRGFAAATATPALLLLLLLLPLPPRLLLLLCPAPLSLPVPTSAIQVRVTASPLPAQSLQAAVPSRLRLQAAGSQFWQPRGVRGALGAAALRALSRLVARAPNGARLPHPASAPRSCALSATQLWQQELEDRNLTSPV